MSMKWTDTLDIAIELDEAHPDADPMQEFCDYLNFRFAIASERGRDVDSTAAFEEWIESGMPGFDPLVTSPEQDSLP